MLLGVVTGVACTARPEPRACTLIACSSWLSIDLEKATPWVADYTIEGNASETVKLRWASGRRLDVCR